MAVSSIDCTLMTVPNLLLPLLRPQTLRPTMTGPRARTLGLGATLTEQSKTRLPQAAVVIAQNRVPLQTGPEFTADTAEGHPPLSPKPKNPP